jgi:D-alanyl-D-alanine carboxypeptidase
MIKLDATLCRTKTRVPAAPVLLALFAMIASFDPQPAEARDRRDHHDRHAAQRAQAVARPGHKRDRAPRHVRTIERSSPETSPKFAAIVVDANSGRTLYARNEHEPRRPASITKVMTLYLLFEQIDKGRFRLDSPITISARAAAQAPTKLGLRKGETISVEDAIKAIVTRSANDIATAIAEAVGGDEETFAALMTRKARALGMSRTNFANASGLPNDAQVTTAHDLALLGRAMKDHFPHHFRHFSLPAFTYRGTTIKNHNRLLKRVAGMNGIKTGYTQASGFNLLTSVKRNGRDLIAVVMGGSSAAGRDKIMADLIESHIDQCASVRTVAAIPLPGPEGQATPNTPVQPLAPSRAAVEARLDPKPTPRAPFVPVSLRPGLAVDAAQVRAISADVPQDRPRPAFVSGAPRPSETVPAGAANRPREQAVLDGSTGRKGSANAAGPTATPSTMRELIRSVTQADAAPARLPAMASRSDVVNDAEKGRPAAAQRGWMIQVGATDEISKANELLARARREAGNALASAEPFTERVEKGSTTLYRARFAGFDADSAALACKTLQRSGMPCFTTKN